MVSIEDELNGYLDSIREPSGIQASERELLAKRLLEDLLKTCQEISTALLARRVPPVDLYVRSDKPASRLTHFFKGDDSNPLQQVAQGWQVMGDFVIDTLGGLRARDQYVDDKLLVESVDLKDWYRQLAIRDWGKWPISWSCEVGFIHVDSDEDGDTWLASTPTVYGPDSRMYHEREPIRTALIKATARRIAEHESGI